MTTKAQQLKTIDHAFYALPQIFHGFSSVADKLFKMNLEAERQHRKGYNRTHPRNFSANAAARLFTVRHLAEALDKPNRYSVTDILHIRTECLYAQAYATEHRAEILAAWDAAKVDREAIMAVDYSELMEA